MNSVTTRMQKTAIVAVVRHKRPSIFGKLIPKKFREQDSNLYANQASRMRLKIGTVGAAMAMARGRNDRDALTMQPRYLESKHEAHEHLEGIAA